MTPGSPVVRFIKQNGWTYPMSYLVWPNFNPANYFYANKIAKAQLASLGDQQGV